MYKLLLSSRYLRTRFIALASIVSVTLGVATMIVVNSVMSGFGTQMKERIKGIRADVTVRSIDANGASDPERTMRHIEEEVGDYIEAMTPTVEVYGMMKFHYAGHDVVRPVTLIGIVPETKEIVSPLRQFLATRSPRDGLGNRSLPPLRSADEPLDWALTPEATKFRAEWIEFVQFQNNFERNDRLRINNDQVQRVQGISGTAGGEVDQSVRTADQNTLSVDTLSVDSLDLPETAANDDGLDDFMAPSQPPKQIDPNTPLPARLYVGEGLISFHYKDKTTGQLKLHRMVEPGMDVNLTTYKIGTPQPASMAATVVDVFKCGMSEYDSNLVFCNLEQLQVARGMLALHGEHDWRRGTVTHIQLKLKNYADAAHVLDRLRSSDKLPMEYYEVQTWEQEQGPLLQAVEIEAAILNVLLFLIIAVAGFGILAIFYMIVVEKTKDIGVLKALGASSRGIMSIFLGYGLSLGIVGAGAGVVLGLLFIHYINEIEAVLSYFMGHKVFDETIYYFHEIPTRVSPWMVLSVALGAMAIAVLASILPARRAARLHPVQALRYE